MTKITIIALNTNDMFLSRIMDIRTYKFFAQAFGSSNTFIAPDKLDNSATFMTVSVDQPPLVCLRSDKNPKFINFQTDISVVTQTPDHNDFRQEFSAFCLCSLGIYSKCRKHRNQAPMLILSHQRIIRSFLYMYCRCLRQTAACSLYIHSFAAYMFILSLHTMPAP